MLNNSEYVYLKADSFSWLDLSILIERHQGLATCDRYWDMNLGSTKPKRPNAIATFIATDLFN